MTHAYPALFPFRRRRLPPMTAGASARLAVVAAHR